jgi:hypothetical protein
MPKKAADGGGNYLGSEGLVALADANAVVLAQRVERDRGLDPDNGEDDGKLFAALLAEHKDATRASVREANAKLGDKGGDGAPAGDDEPPW